MVRDPTRPNACARPSAAGGGRAGGLSLASPDPRPLRVLLVGAGPVHAGGAPNRLCRPGVLVADDAHVAIGVDAVAREASRRARPAAVGHRLPVRLAGAG